MRKDQGSIPGRIKSFQLRKTSAHYMFVFGRPKRSSEKDIWDFQIQQK
jgi:hypothetical protein